MFTATLTGNLGKDVTKNEVGEKAVLNFSVAVKEVKKSDDQKAKWVECELWLPKDKTEGFEKMLTTGTLVACIGEPYADAYVPEGQKKAQEVQRMRVEKVEVLSSKNE